VEALARDRAVLDRDEAVTAEAPLKPSPLADQNEAAAGPQDLRNRARVEPTVDLSDEIEEVVGIGETARAPLLERDAALWVEADPSHRGADRIRRGIDSAHTCGGELSREEEHAVAGAAADLKDALWVLWQMKGSRREGRQRGFDHGSII
jgi:hypothetical protein